MNEATLNYVRQHADDDVSLLALRGCKDPGVDLPYALQQIEGRQTARQKLPSWAALDAIQYPVHLSMEQCSSEQTARYKARLCRRLLETSNFKPQTSNFKLQTSCVPSVASDQRSSANLKPQTSNFKLQTSKLLDLTGGFGVDFIFMSEAFDEAVYVERNDALYQVASANIALLCPHATTLCADGISVLQQSDHATVIFLDPARRDDHGGRTYGIADCTPNVLDILQQLLQKADYVVLKLSPMLDWRKAVQNLGEQFVREVHIVSVANECKELLLVLSAEGAPLAIYCQNDDQHFSPGKQEELENLEKLEFLEPLEPLEKLESLALPQSATPYLYEPNASIMKAGCFAQLAAQYGVAPIAPNSHLFLAARLIADFPGRIFRITAVTTMNKRDLKRALGSLTQANIATRNFPLSVAELRRRLKLKDGGETYIFATTQTDGTRILIVCRK